MSRSQPPQVESLARVALAAHAAAQKAAHAMVVAIDALTLAALPDRWADLVTEAAYAAPGRYSSNAHNAMGLFDWERRVVDEHFPCRGTVLVTSAGGGREALALAERGYRVVATECVAPLARALEHSLRALGTNAVALHLPPDSVPQLEGPFDAIVIGWAAYTHLIGRDRRIRFLCGLRDASAPGAPILASYWQVDSFGRSSRLPARIANLVRRPLRRRPVELGETTAVLGWSRLFTPGEVRLEAAAAGLDVLDERSQGFPHIVLRRHPSTATDNVK